MYGGAKRVAPLTTRSCPPPNAQAGIAVIGLAVAGQGQAASTDEDGRSDLERLVDETAAKARGAAAAPRFSAAAVEATRLAGNGWAAVMVLDGSLQVCLRGPCPAYLKTRS